jgi:capsular polysaccharide export protein
LQGPVGPFFKKLQTHLAANGADVWRVCFHAGDAHFSNRENRFHFFGGLTQWRSWIRAELASGQYGCVLLFGSKRPAHVIARQEAAAAGVRVSSLEEGYVRPGYITVEEGGNNAVSPAAGLLPPPEYTPAELGDDPMLESGFKTMIRNGGIY